jgi:hypothetical protein
MSAAGRRGKKGKEKKIRKTKRSYLMLLTELSVLLDKVVYVAKDSRSDISI